MHYLAWTLVIASLFAAGCDGCSADDPADVESVDDWIDERAEPFDEVGQLQSLIARADDRQLILLGEATHGTREFYESRADLTLAIAERQGLDFVAVEGDWIAARAADRYVMGDGDASDVEAMLRDNFDRWPQHWMWANEEFADFLTRVRRYNADNPERPIRIYGIDMHGFFDSLNRLTERLEDESPDDADAVMEALGCLREFSPDPGRYARHIQAQATEGCQYEIEDAVDKIRQWYDGDDIDDLSARKHARVVAAGEAQYRERIQGPPGAFWNVRATHMFDATQGMLDHHGEDARGVVWAHNTHVGDARATDMAAQNRVNIGQLARQALGADTVLSVGFSTLHGDVIAARQQGAMAETMALPTAADGSLDEILNRHDESRFLVEFSDGDAELPFWTDRPGHRAVGVTYHPDREYPGNYVDTNPAARYDAIIVLETTSALRPL